jgi:hypothetical protein
MRRSLVLYNESKRHWLRQQLPPAVLAIDPAILAPASVQKGQGQTAESLRLFLLTYIAGFLAFTTFIF